MKKLLAIVLSSLMLMSTGCDAKMNYNRVAYKAQEVSVVIHAKIKVKDLNGNERTGRSGCSGTYVDEDKVLTAAHCFVPTGVSLIWVRGIDNHSYTAEIMKIDVPHDLCLLWVHGVHNHAYAIIGRDPHVGDEIMNMGFPFGLEFVASRGIVSALDLIVMPFKSHYMLTDAMINPGSSGGGAFNKKGQLVGVNTMTIGSFFGWNGISVAVSTQDIRNFLR